MADLVSQKVTSSGITPTQNPATLTDTKIPFGSIARVFNGGGAPITVTAVTPGTVDGNPIGDKAITVAASGANYVRPTVDYRDADTGLVTLLFSAVTTVSVEVVH